MHATAAVENVTPETIAEVDPRRLRCRGNQQSLLVLFVIALLKRHQCSSMFQTKAKSFKIHTMQIFESFTGVTVAPRRHVMHLLHRENSAPDPAGKPFH